MAKHLNTRQVKKQYRETLDEMRAHLALVLASLHNPNGSEVEDWSGWTARAKSTDNEPEAP
jgi:hypothetical protein